MSKKTTDTTRQRLAKLAAESRNPGPDYFKGLRADAQEPEREIDYSNELHWAALASAALTLDEKWPDYRYLDKAFKEFGLDPINPMNWRKLISYFAEVHFKSKSAGAPRKWTPARRWLLMTRVDAIKKHDPTMKVGLMAKVIIHHWPDDYGSIQSRTLEKYLTDLLRAH
jgi:hypothetical protein